MHVLPLIDSHLWDRAGWQGIAFNYQEGKPPLLAFVFEHGHFGRQVIRGLRATTGNVDAFEVIRIAFIEGDIPGEPEGCTIHVGVNDEGVRAKAIAEGVPLAAGGELEQAGIFMRISTSPALARFKDSLAARQRYLLGCASARERAVFVDLTIEKTLVVIKHVGQIDKNDVDKVIFATDSRARPS